MIIQIAGALKNPEKAFPFSGEVALEAASLGSDILALPPVRVEGACTGFTSNSLRFAGEIHVVIEATCGKCLEKVEYSLDIPFEEMFLREGSAESEEEDRFTFSGDGVELDDMVRTYVLLELPIRYICKQGCRQESIQELDAAAAKAARDISPFAVLLDIDGGGVADGITKE